MIFMQKQFARYLLVVYLCLSIDFSLTADSFDVLAFYTAKNDQAHISFVEEANTWFKKIASENNFVYETTDDWTKLNDKYLSGFELIIFLDTRPENIEQRNAFERYIEKGGAWMGFHFAAFALDPSDFPNDWNWYQNDFLGCGAYLSNTWRPTSAVLKVENHQHPVTKNLPDDITSAPNEWYRWEKDLRQNADIEILLSIDPISFPLGTGPKPHEIWHKGYYPVVWTNNKYRMIYFNMGHNDIDYENGTGATLSYTFENVEQNKLILNGVFWLASVSKVDPSH